MRRSVNRRQFLSAGGGALAWLAAGSLNVAAWGEDRAASLQEKLPKGCSSSCPTRYPGAEWESISPSEAGFNEQALQKLIPTVGVGGVIIRHGYLVASWGNPNVGVNTASLGKSCTSTCLGLAVDAGLVKLDDLVYQTWTGEGQLSHPYKYLNVGHHAKITWRHFATMTSGFPNIDLSSPDGEMGDITSNYAKRPPGEVFEYSDGALWRFSQALTKLWGRDLKELLDEKVLSPIGVPAQRWDWLPGKMIFENLLYPFWPGYGRYLDPPWEIDGQVVRAGPGWVIINANDAARFGYLFLRKGRWQGKQLISESWVKQVQQPGSRAHAASGGTDYNLNWWIPRTGIFEARGGNINWQAVSRISVVPEYDLVVASIRTSYRARKTLESSYVRAGDQDWLFRLLNTIVK